MWSYLVIQKGLEHGCSGAPGPVRLSLVGPHRIKTVDTTFAYAQQREDQSTIISITVTFLYRNSYEQDTDPMYLVAIAIIVLTDGQAPGAPQFEGGKSHGNGNQVPVMISGTSLP